VCKWASEPVKIEIINIGDEILIGQVINTNAAWMAQKLNQAGYRADQFTVVADTRGAILQSLQDASQRADLVLVSGGLGPTKDDITKQTICDFFDTRLVLDKDALKDIETLFAKRGWGKLINDLNRKQAELPESCISLPNYLGTARGMWFSPSGQVDKGTSEQENTDRPSHIAHRASHIAHRASHIAHRTSVFVFLPGVPFEMHELFEREVLPRIQKQFPAKAVYHKTVLTQGTGESMIAEILHDWEIKLPPHIKLAYLPQPGMVRLRFTANGEDRRHLEEEVEKEIQKLHQLIPDLIFGYDNDTLEHVVGSLLAEQGKTLAIAESCTGGTIAEMITSIPGSSRYFLGGIVSYANEAKEALLGVKHTSLVNHGAVSEQVAKEMALGIQKRLQADFAIATTGIAGPDGGTPEKPVGTVWIAIATPEGVEAHQYLFGDHRQRNIRRTSLQALSLLRKQLIRRA
jgi:nicotinamide-nucleotide amidase